MPTFRYQAVDLAGKTHKASLQADSERHARQLLREQGLFPEDLVEFTDADKSPLDLAEASAIETEAWCDTLDDMVAILCATKTEEKKKKGQERNSQGGARHQQSVDYDLDTSY
jgi:type II secretory pathway component PulF